MVVEVLLINFLKQITGVKPEMEVVHREPACPGPWPQRLYMRVQPFCSAVSPSMVQGRSGCMQTVDMGMSLHLRAIHKIALEAVVKSCSHAQQPGNHTGIKKTFRTSAGLMAW